MTKKTITIIGGHGLMGELFARLFGELEHCVHKLGRREWDTAAPILAASDLVIVSVPINSTLEIIKQTAPLLKPQTILADFTSLKVEPVLTMLANHLGPVVGLHPMFGPTITTTAAQVVVVCDGRQSEYYQWLIEDLSRLGFTLKNLPAGQHDQAMSFIQGVEHFITFALGTFLQHKNQHPQKLLEIASPIYLAKLLLMGRIFDQDPKLYADIIMADKERLALISEFAEWLNNWSHQLQAGNKDEFIAAFSSARDWMGEFTAYAQNISDHFLNIEQPDKE